MNTEEETNAMFSLIWLWYAFWPK